jgi:hypothetical protein
MHVRENETVDTRAQPAHFRVNKLSRAARGGNQVFGQRHTRPVGGSATTSSTHSSTHCARTVSNFLICGLFICAV